MRLLLLSLLLAYVAARSHKTTDPCDLKDCRAGRECLVVEGEAQCLCVASCPDHFKPVCGTDGVSYDSHCKLHQEACVSGVHISIKHKGFCKKSFDKKWKSEKRKKLLGEDDLKRQILNDVKDDIKKESKNPLQKEPIACFSPQRNALRFLIATYLEEKLQEQPWHVRGMSQRESLWGWFFACNEEKDNGLTPVELLTCARNVSFNPRPGQNAELTKAMCIDAIIEDGDKNDDLALDFEEFVRVMNVKYQPEEKKCSLEGKLYRDGEEVKMNCNRCTCAIGNFVCSSTECDNEKTTKTKDKTSFSSSTDLDNFIDDSDLPKSTVVADLWMENNHRDKKKSKQQKKMGLEFIEDEEPKTNEDLVKEDQKTDEDKVKEEELMEDEINDYMDEIYEATKLKNGKKNKYVLEKALKEIKYLKRKTEELKSMLKKDKTKKEVKPFNVEKKQKKHQILKQKRLQEQYRPKHKPSPKEHAKWMNLINWGDYKDAKMQSGPNEI